MKRVVVVGAGVGGLTTAAVLAKAGLDVTVLEAHIYPGGCAGTFYHQGYRFDAGATLAGGFYPGGPMDLVAKATGIDDWDTRPSNPTLVVHLPDGSTIPRWSDERRWSTRLEVFGQEAESFFQWQERTADAVWALALKGIPWPPQSPREGLALLSKGIAWSVANPFTRLNPSLLADGVRPVSTHLRGANDDLRFFVDAQLLISAQATSEKVNALYGASALDLPRRGAVHIRGGISGISTQLMDAIQRHGGRVLLRKQVTQVRKTDSQTYQVEVKRDEPKAADIIIFNLTPWNIRSLLEPLLPKPLHNLTAHPDRGWGAFTIYLGVDDTVIPEGFALHHQLIAERPLAEGNSIFFSINPEWDRQRAPSGKRAITISSHTKLEQWWHPQELDSQTYQEKRQDLREKILRAVESLLPGINQHTDLILDGTPQTFAYFTRRERGWVGGFPQVNLFQGMAPRLSQNLWMVGDSIFPGQSTAAVALGGLRVASGVLTHTSRHSNIRGES
jgi:C-3',4' desaturase CrtD